MVVHGYFGNFVWLMGFNRSWNMLVPRSGFTVDRWQCCFIDRQSCISSTAFSREEDWPLFSKTGISSATGFWLTSNRRHWKANSKVYLVSKEFLNLTVGRSPYIAKHLTRMCSSALKRFQNHHISPERTWTCKYSKKTPKHNNYILKHLYTMAEVGKIHDISTPPDLPFCLSSSKTDESLWKRFENSMDSHDLKLRIITSVILQSTSKNS